MERRAECRARGGRMVFEVVLCRGVEMAGGGMTGWVVRLNRKLPQQGRTSRFFWPARSIFQLLAHRHPLLPRSSTTNQPPASLPQPPPQPTTTMAPIQKKRKTTAAATKSTPKPAPAAAPAVENDEAEDSDKYASAESESEAEDGDEYDLASESSADDSDDSISSLVAAQGQLHKKKRKRNDADAFSLTMGKILGSHLTTKARKDPVLVRAKQSQDHVDDGKLEAKARRIMKEEIRKEKEKGRVRDLVPKDDDEAAGKALAKERALKSIARSGVAKLYNAVRAAQIKGEEASKEVKKDGVVGMGNRDAKGMSQPPELSGPIANSAAFSHRDVKTGLLGPHPVGEIDLVMNGTGVFFFLVIATGFLWFVYSQKWLFRRKHLHEVDLGSLLSFLHPISLLHRRKS